VFVGTLLAAATGVVAATVIVMGVLALPVMIKYGYDHELASGVIVASGTLAQLIPPSLVLIVLAQFIPVSVGQLFAGALIPGILLATLFAGYAVMVAYSKPNSAPAIPRSERQLSRRELSKQFFLAVVPPLGLIVAVLGSIFKGIATASEAGAVGAVGAAVLALVYRRLTWKVLWQAARSTSNITSLVLQILLASTFFALVFDRLGGQDRITAWLQNVPGGLWGFIIASHIIVFLLGINLEFLEISFIVMPLLIPAAIALDVNLVWFAVLMAVNLNLAFISPPVGFSLFYLQSVAPPEVKTAEIHRGAIPFMGVQCIGLLVLTLLPEAVVYPVTGAGLGNELTNNTDFVPGPFVVRLMICIVGVALIGTFWSWRIRRKYPRPQNADVEPATPVIA
jgi:tripartite ATP-independent transporter DctM subunit